jgi:hypothetical protein
MFLGPPGSLLADGRERAVDPIVPLIKASYARVFTLSSGGPSWTALRDREPGRAIFLYLDPKRMNRTTLRLAAALGLALLLAGCDKCGNMNITVPGAAAPTSCTDVKPRG